MEFFSGISAFVKEATDHLDGLILSFNEDGEHVNGGKGSNQKRPLKEKAKCAEIMSLPTYKFFKRMLADKEVSRRAFLKCKGNIASTLETFNMDERKISHARKVIQLLPELDRLRFQMCPSVLSDKEFWRIYFTIFQIQEEKSLKNNSTVNSGSSLQNMTGKSKTNLSNTHASTEGFTTDFDPAQAMEASIAALAEDVSMVSNLIVDGAKKTLRLAEQLMESVDEQASEVIRPTISPRKESVSQLQEKRMLSVKPRAIADIPVPTESTESDVQAKACILPSIVENALAVEEIEFDEGWTFVDAEGKSHRANNNNDEPESDYQLI